MKEYYVYIMSSGKKGTLYIGVTSNLIKRVYQHKKEETKGFTSKYQIKYLVYFESTTDIYEALTREKNLKAWKREWKIMLIEQKNPHWEDLYAYLIC